MNTVAQLKTFQVKLHGVVVGFLQQYSNGTWSGQPRLGGYGCTYSKRDEAIIDLMLHSEVQRTGFGLVQ